jgi:tetratricopeptide (TPR) repeat protein
MIPGSELPAPIYVMLSSAPRRSELAALRRQLRAERHAGLAGLTGSGRLSLARLALPDADVITFSAWSAERVIPEAGLIVDARGVVFDSHAHPFQTTHQPHNAGPVLWLLDARPAGLAWCAILNALPLAAAKALLLQEARTVDPMFDASHLNSGQWNELWRNTDGLPGLLSLAGKALPSLGFRATNRALVTLGHPDNVLDQEWFTEPLLKRVAALDAAQRSLTTAALAVDRTLPIESLMTLAGLPRARSASLVGHWFDSGLLLPATEIEQGVSLPAPVRSTLRHSRSATQLPIAEAVERLFDLHTPVPDDPDAALEESAWSDLLYAATLAGLPALLRWKLLQRLDDTARTPAQLAALQSIGHEGSDDPVDRLLLARRLRRTGQFDLSLSASTAALNNEALLAAACLEHGRTLYASGRLQESSTMLGSLPDDAPPAWRCEALRTRAAIALAFDLVHDARLLAQSSLHIATSNGLSSAKARAMGLLASIEMADSRLEPALEHLLQVREFFRKRNDSRGELAAQVTLASLYIAQQRHADADVVLTEAELALARREDSALLSMTFAARALSHMDQGNWTEARSWIERGFAFTTDRQPRVYAWLGAHAGVWHALQGDRDTARNRFADTVVRFARMGDLRNTRLFGGWMALLADVPEEAAAIMGHSAPSSAELLALASLRQGDPPRPCESAWIRLASQFAQVVARPTLAHDGHWILTSQGERIDLTRRTPARKILATLIHAMEHRLGALSTAELFAAAWPGDRSRQDAARARVYVAVNELRRSGLASVLRSDANGYWLQGVRVHAETDDT